jgi:hypothetical protein
LANKIAIGTHHAPSNFPEGTLGIFKGTIMELKELERLKQQRFKEVRRQAVN